MAPAPDSSDAAASSATVKDRREEVLERYAATWRSGSRPSVPDYLSEVSESERPGLLRELLSLDVSSRRGVGETPQVADYEFLLRDHRAVVEEALSPALAGTVRAPERGTSPPGVNGATADLPTFIPASSRVELPTIVSRVHLETLPLLVEETSSLLPVVVAAASDAITLAPNGSGAGLPVAVCKEIPGYEILGKLGEGGMGVVYKARQIALNRTVALKMILSGIHANEQDLTRFRTEAEAIARSQHPHIVQVYEIGEHEGKPYFSLEYCGGGSLKEKLRGMPLPPKEAAALAETLAHAVQAAHDRHIIHRDLKPANVLLTVDGTPKITDFGLAKKLDEVGQTMSGVIMGSPSYMAPEQAAGDTKAVGPATDIYSLGAILYELLSGRPPFQAATPLDTLLQALENDPVPLRLLNPQVDRDLETICLTCLEKNPALRYASARLLALDLGRYLRGEAISVRSINIMERLTRTLQRSQIDAGFESWGTVLLWFAVIVLGSQIALFAVIGSRQSELLVNATQSVQFLLMGLVVWYFRSPQMFTLNAAKKHLASIWSGFLIASGLVVLVSQLLVGLERMYDFFLYPYWAILSGLAFFVMGSTYWGWFYAFGLAFFALAALLPLCPMAGPLVFGSFWAGSLAIIGRRLREKAKSRADG